MRQAAGGGKRLDVFLRRIVRPVAERQRAVEKLRAGARADFDELRDGEFFQRGARFGDARQVLADDAGVDLADSGDSPVR